MGSCAVPKPFREAMDCGHGREGEPASERFIFEDESLPINSERTSWEEPGNGVHVGH